MPARFQYVPTTTMPYLPREVALERLRRHSREDGRGCLVWTASRHKNKRGILGAGFIRVWGPSGRVHLFAHKLAWWCEHGEYPDAEMCVTHTCSTRACIRVDHLRLVPEADLRSLTDAQVTEARELYWPPHLKLNRRQRKEPAPTAEQLAAWAVGLSVGAVRRVMAGKRVRPDLWHGRVNSVAQVQAAVRAHQESARQRRQARATCWTMSQLAGKYGVSLSLMAAVLNGERYGHVPMPEAARIRLQRAGQEAFVASLEVPEPRRLPDGSVDYSQPSDWSVKLRALRRNPPAVQRISGAMDNVF